MKNRSYFSLDSKFNPFNSIDRLLNPFNHVTRCMLDGNEISIALTRRARYALSQLQQPLLVEMQLYFSCMIKKRVLFSTQPTSIIYKAVDRHLHISFRSVQSDSCDPLEFASRYPGKRTLDSAAALKMHPRELSIDYKNRQWLGEFVI